MFQHVRPDPFGFAQGRRGGGMAVMRGGSVKHISLVELYAVRPEHSQGFGPEVLRPAPFGCAQGLP